MYEKFNLKAFENVEILHDIFNKKAIKMASDYKSTDDGKDGKIFEQCIKIIFRNVKNLKVSFNGKKDTYKKINGKICSFEIKTGGGEIAPLDRDGNITDNHYFESDFIVYCKKFDYNKPLASQTIVVADANTFYEIFKSEHLTRFKRSNYMDKQPKHLQYKDRISFSVDGESRSPKADRLINYYLENGVFMSLEQFLKTY